MAQVRAAGTTPEYRRAMVGYILLNPVYVFQFKNSDVAAGLAKQALGDAGLKLFAAGKTMKQASYDVQHQAWSNRKSPTVPAAWPPSNRPPRTRPLPLAEDQVPALQRAASGATPLTITASPAEPPYPPLVAHALQLAAVAALGEADDSTYDSLTASHRRRRHSSLPAHGQAQPSPMPRRRQATLRGHILSGAARDVGHRLLPSEERGHGTAPRTTASPATGSYHPGQAYREEGKTHAQVGGNGDTSPFSETVRMRKRRDAAHSGTRRQTGDGPHSS